MSDIDVSARIAAMEEEIAALKAEVSTSGDPTARVHRRSLLRGGAALAGVAGATALLNSGATAQAATGNMQFGAANDADVSVTTLTSGSNPTLSLINDVDTLPALMLSTTGTTPAAIASRGSFFVEQTDGQLMYCDRTWVFKGANARWGKVLTTTNANYLTILPTPVRVLDSRNGTGVPVGKRAAGTKTTVDVSSAGTGALAVIGFVSAITPNASGYLTLYKQDPLVQIRSGSYTTGEDMTSLSMVALTANTFRLFNSAVTHIVYDVVALVSNA